MTEYRGTLFKIILTVKTKEKQIKKQNLFSDICTPMLITALFIIAKIEKQA